MDNVILLKRSSVPSFTPSVTSLSAGELAINVSDGVLFTKRIVNGVESVVSFLNNDNTPYKYVPSLSSIVVADPAHKNTTTQVFATVLGGYYNDVSGGGSTVINGENNDVAGDYALIGGGADNLISNSGDYGAILGGKDNTLNHQESFIIGSNITSHASNFTYVNNISAQGVLYGDGSGLTNLAAVPAPDTEVRALTSNWQSTYTSYNSNSSSFVTTSFADLKYVPLSGATMTGTLAAPTLSATTFYGNGSNVTNINASNINSGTLSAERLPIFNGDITANTSNGSVSATVVAIQGHPVSVQNPANGQILQWNGTAWVPGSTTTGGSGGGGVTYYFNYANYTNISPTDGLPTSPVAPSLLGREYSVGSGSLQSGELTENVYTLVAGFVSLSSEPAVTNIPAGIWDFNIWVDIFGNTSSNQTSMQVRVYKYISSTSTYTPLASSEDLYIYDPTVIAQYIASVTIPQTTLLSSDRIYIEFWAAKSVNQSRHIRFWFDSSHPSHVHTTLPSVAGSGLVKTVNGVYQSPASLLVNTDVAANAAIDQSKINGLTDVANKANSAFTTVQSNSANWDSTYNTVSSLSSNWNTAYLSTTALNLSSSNWNTTFTNVQSNSANWQTAYAYVSANSVNLTATNVFVTNDLTVTDTVSAKYFQGTLIDWMTLVRGYKTTPTLLATIGTGEVYTYVYATTASDRTYYRYIATNGSEDSFYGNFTNPTLSNLITTKKIIL